MIDLTLLEKKKKLQRIRNILKVADGIEVIEICDGLSIDIENYYSSEKIPDSIITPDENIYNKIIKYMHIQNNMITFIMCEGVPVKIRITDVKTAVKSLWNTYHEIMIIDENLTKVYEIGNDSRDEYNYLFDIFYIKKPE